MFAELVRRSILFAVAIVLLAGAPAVAAGHPLDPLSAEEIAATRQVLQAAGKISDASRFSLMALHEPDKGYVLSYKPGDPVRREAFAVIYERAANKTYEALVDIQRKTLLSWKEIPGVEPAVLPEETQLTEDIVRADPQWQAAIRKRGITDFNNVRVGLWTAGVYGLANEEGRRIVRAVSYYSPGTSNFYARPIGGVTVYVDLNAKKVFKVIDTGVVIIPAKPEELDAIGKRLPVVKPLLISQPEGASFEVNGNEVRWQNWRFRFGMQPRDGLVLYTVAYEDHGKLRPVMYRGSLSELVVPYSDPDQAWFFRNAFDEGEDNLGHEADSLEPGADAPSNARFFDAEFADQTGAPTKLPRAVALYERDGGLLWKHVDERTGQNESRRARELVLAWIASDGNYEYGFNWVFRQDASLEMEILLTGILQPKDVERTSDEHHGEMGISHSQLVSEHIEAPYHQHFFSFRLDMDVDGPSNRVVEIDTLPVASKDDNPFGGAFSIKETTLHRESEGKRQLNSASSRFWEVINPSVKNTLGQPVGYMLMPGENSLSYAAPDSWLRKRAGFLSGHLWVTRYDPSQMYAAGDYVNQGRGGDGLPRWIEADRPIDSQDIVLWYTMGVTHITRPEEWPVMTVHRTAFKLVPCSFFSRNPGLDVPKQ